MHAGNSTVLQSVILLSQIPCSVGHLLCSRIMEYICWFHLSWKSLSRSRWLPGGHCRLGEFLGIWSVVLLMWAVVCVCGNLNQLGAVNEMELKRAQEWAVDRSVFLNKGCEHFCSCSYDCLCSDIEAFISTGLLLCWGIVFVLKDRSEALQGKCMRWKS